MSRLKFPGESLLAVEYWREYFEERAAIIQYDGQVSKELAEVLALREVKERAKASESSEISGSAS